MTGSLSLPSLGFSVGRDIALGTFRVVKHGGGDRGPGNRGMVVLFVGIRGKSSTAAAGALGDIGRTIDSPSPSASSEGEKDRNDP